MAEACCRMATQHRAASKKPAQSRFARARFLKPVAFGVQFTLVLKAIIYIMICALATRGISYRSCGGKSWRQSFGPLRGTIARVSMSAFGGLGASRMSSTCL